MTDPSSASWRRRRRGGKYQDPTRRPGATPASPDAARRNRDAAFGMPKRTWVGSSSASSSPDESSPETASEPSPEAGAESPEPAAGEESPGTASESSPEVAAEPPEPAAGAGGTDDRPASRGHGRRAARQAEPVEPAADEDTPDEDAPEADAWSVAPEPVPEAPDAAPAGAAAAGAAPAGAASAGSAASTSSPSKEAGPPPADRGRPRRRRSERSTSGSLPLVAFWTVVTSFVPGTGLITTRLRLLGWILLGVLVAGGAAVGLWLLLGEPLRIGVRVVTNRNLLIGTMLCAALVGIVWLGQIVLANRAHTRQQRLRGARRWIALAVAALMVLALALPFGRGVQSLWATQGLLGSDTVFSPHDEDDRLSPGEDPWEGVGRMNIMLLGQDAGADRTGTRPDTIMVASIDTETGNTALFSIPRNLEHVRFPEGTPAAEEFPDGFRHFGEGQDLINAVWTWADNHPDLYPDETEPGLTATTGAVEETLGLEMDYYAMVNLRGFEDLVDAIGGVDLVVERRIPIGGGASSVDGYIEPGEQHLDGYQALWYARSREGSNDFDRMCRQQRIVRAVTEEADPSTLAMSVPGLVNATEENIQTNIPVSRLDAFADLALRIKDAGFTSYPITQDVTPSYDADWDYIKTWVDASIEDSMQQEEPESVIGETEDGSTDPAPTGETTPGEEGADGAGEPSEQETTEEPPTEDETPTEEETTSAEETSPSGDPSQDPEIEQDPLESCLPGAQQG